RHVGPALLPRSAAVRRGFPPGAPSTDATGPVGRADLARLGRADLAAGGESDALEPAQGRSDEGAHSLSSVSEAESSARPGIPESPLESAGCRPPGDPPAQARSGPRTGSGCPLRSERRWLL